MFWPPLVSPTPASQPARERERERDSDVRESHVINKVWGAARGGGGDNGCGTPVPVLQFSGHCLK